MRLCWAARCLSLGFQRSRWKHKTLPLCMCCELWQPQITAGYRSGLFSLKSTWRRIPYENGKVCECATRWSTGSGRGKETRMTHIYKPNKKNPVSPPLKALVLTFVWELHTWWGGRGGGRWGRGGGWRWSACRSVGGGMGSSQTQKEQRAAGDHHGRHHHHHGHHPGSLRTNSLL